MIRTWVVNASPSIFLAKLDQLSLLSKLCDELIVPHGVAQEIFAGPTDDPAAQWLRQTGKSSIAAPTDIEPSIAAWDLGAGESEVLSWCHRQAGYEAIIDDGMARKCAMSLNIPVRGTLGILLLAKKERHLAQIAPSLDDLLLRMGYRIEPRLIQAVLTFAGEGQ